MVIMLEIHELRQLVAVADCGTLSAAAERLHISQPVLSRAMRRIEEKLDMGLFTRSGGNHISLNNAGLLAVSEARGVLQLLDTMEQRLADHAMRQKTIRIASCAPLPMVTLLTRLTVLVPSLTVATELKDEESLREGLLNGGYAYVVTQKPIREPGIVSALYDAEQLHVSFPLSHPLSHRDTVSFQDLEGETMLIHEGLGAWEDVQSELRGKVNFISPRDNRGMEELIFASSLPCFATNLTGSYSTPANPRIEVPVSWSGAIKNYYLSCPVKHREMLEKLLPYPQEIDA